MATVQMDLAELELLKKQKEELEREVETQKKLSEGLRVTMAEIKSDKKVLERVKTRTEVSLPENSLDVIERTLRAYQHHMTSNTNYGPNSHFHRDGFSILAGKVKDSLAIRSRLTSETEVVNFINASDFKEALLEKLSEDLVRENGKLKAEAKIADEVLADLQEQHKVDLIRKEDQWAKTESNLKEAYEKSEEELHDSYKGEIKGYQDRIADLNVRIEELETGVKNRTEMEALQEKVTKLQEALQQEKSRSFWQKLFGTGSPDTRSLEKVIER